MDALTAIRNKRDTRSYSDEPVTPEMLGRVLDAATIARSPASSSASRPTSTPR